MTDATLFYISLWVLYAIECVQRAPKSSIVLVQNRKNAFFIRKPLNVVANSLNGSFFLANLLSPNDLTFLGAGSPISCSATGIRISGAREDRLLTWHEIDSVGIAGTEIVLNGEIRIEFTSTARAKRTAAEILRLKKCPDQDRTDLVRSIVRGSLDVQRLCFAMDRLNRHIGILPDYCLILFLLMFLVAPVLGWFYNLSVAIIFSVPLVWLLSIRISFLASRFHAETIGAGSKPPRSKRLYLALYPPAAVAALLVVTKDFLADFHPLALSFHLADRRDFRKFASAWLRDFVYASPPADRDFAVQDFQGSHFEITKCEIESFFSQRGMSMVEFIRPPDDFAHDGAVYCPRCLALYGGKRSVCSDCGIELVKHQPPREHP